MNRADDFFAAERRRRAREALADRWFFRFCLGGLFLAFLILALDAMARIG